MARLITFGCVVTLIVALFMEWYKKGVRGFKDEDGLIYTKASKYELWGVAFALSCGFGVLLHMVGSLELGWWILFIYVPLIFFLQMLIDLKLVKNLVNNLIAKLGEKK